MNLVRLLGCILVGFGLPIAVVARFVVQRSVLFLLLVASAFWALAPTLLSSCLWIAIAPLKSSYVFHILFGVAFQEACRWAMLAGYIRMEKQLISIAPQEHNLALNDAPSSIVLGTGYGTMLAIIQCGGIIAQAWQQGALFLASCSALSVYDMATAQALILTATHAAAGVLLLEAYRKGSLLRYAAVLALRTGVSLASLANTPAVNTAAPDSCVASIPSQLLLAGALCMWAWFTLRGEQYTGYLAARSWAQQQAARTQQSAAQADWQAAHGSRGPLEGVELTRAILRPAAVTGAE